MNTPKKRLFVTEDGKNLAFTFALVSSLFLLWGFCNGMIDVMDRHFQQTLHLTLSQSAWVQFAHWMGYFMMSLPAGYLAIKLGYKGGIIAGLLLVGAGGFWFIPATHIASFWAFLLGVCVIASGLTFLETVANPYTTVLGSKQYAATRINLAQSCNGAGWFFGPIAGAAFFYGKDASGQDIGSQTIWIPYAGVGVVVLVLAVIFFFANVPDLKTADEYHLDDKNATEREEVAPRQVKRGRVYLLLLGNIAALLCVFGMILFLILGGLHAGPRLAGLASSLPHPGVTQLTDQSSILTVLAWAGVAVVAIIAAVLFPIVKKMSHHSIWSHEHFSGATLAQFFYVAAQSGIFAFLINYMIAEPPGLSADWGGSWLGRWLETGPDGLLHITNQGASILASVGFLFFLAGRGSGTALLSKFSAHKVLGCYGVLNVLLTFLVVCKLGWLSVACVFLSYFFMSVMFPTIFALGIFGLGVRAKRASSFIVMGIVGGALLPKLMGEVADKYNMSTGFIVPMLCFVTIALYGYFWPMLSGAKSLHGIGTPGGHSASVDSMGAQAVK